MVVSGGSSPLGGAEVLPVVVVVTEARLVVVVELDVVPSCEPVGTDEPVTVVDSPVSPDTTSVPVVLAPSVRDAAVDCAVRAVVVTEGLAFLHASGIMTSLFLVVVVRWIASSSPSRSLRAATTISAPENLISTSAGTERNNRESPASTCTGVSYRERSRVSATNLRKAASSAKVVRLYEKAVSFRSSTMTA